MCEKSEIEILREKVEFLMTATYELRKDNLKLLTLEEQARKEAEDKEQNERVDSYLTELKERVKRRREVQGPPKPPGYKIYTPDPNRIVSGKNNVFERPLKEEITGLAAKRDLQFCHRCETETLQLMGPAMFGFHCVVSHRGKARCDCCDTYTDLAKVVLHCDATYDVFCKLCITPDSPKKERAIKKRRHLAMKERIKPVSLGSPTSIARALGASSFR